MPGPAKPQQARGSGADTHQGPHPAKRTLPRAAALRLFRGSFNAKPGTPCFSVFLARPLAAMPVMGMAATAIATARTRSAQHNRTGRWRWPVVKPSPRRQSSAVTMDPPVPLPSLRQFESRHQQPGTGPPHPRLKQQDRCCRVGALPTAFTRPTGPRRGITKWQEPQDATGRWARVKPAEVRS